MHSNASRGAKKCTAKYEVRGIVKTTVNIYINDKIMLDVHNSATAGARQ